jgi:hypothetical protein
MRPDLFYQFVQARVGLYNGSTVVDRGQFVYDMHRELSQGFDKILGGFKCVTSNNVPKNRVKGSGTTLTAVIGGDFPDYYVGVFGAVEFAQTDGGYQLLRADQAALRGIMITDGGCRHPGGFAVADSLLTAVGA